MSGKLTKLNDPDETEGRRIYRAIANAEAAAQMSYPRHRARLRGEPWRKLSALGRTAIKQGAGE